MSFMGRTRRFRCSICSALMIWRCRIILGAAQIMRSAAGRRATPRRRRSPQDARLVRSLALSPLDGRYAGKLDALRPLLSEFGLMRCRVQVEVEWFIALPRAGLRRAARRSAAGGARVPARAWSRDFSDADAEAIKEIERTTNHDVKAVEYWLKRALRRRCRSSPARPAFVHFACTSEDINNTSHALMLERGAREVLLPALDALVAAPAPRWRTAHADAADALAHARPDRRRRPRSARRSPTSRRAWRGARERHRRGRSCRPR